jgi:hypothetical protein
LNPVGARVGDRIQMTISTGSLLKATFLLYVFPILCMLGGAVLGNGLGNRVGAQPVRCRRPRRTGQLCCGHGHRARARQASWGSDKAYRPEIIRDPRTRIPGHCGYRQPDRIECPGTDENHLAPTLETAGMIEKVFITSNNTATFVCPQCGNVTTTDVSKFAATNKKITVKCHCNCGHHFTVSLEKRRQYRKVTDLSGMYYHRWTTAIWTRA